MTPAETGAGPAPLVVDAHHHLWPDPAEVLAGTAVRTYGLSLG